MGAPQKKNTNKHKQFTKAKISKASDTINKLAKLAGVNINGSKPYDIKVNNTAFYARSLSEQSIGLGESYMEQWWDCDQIDELFNKMMQGNLEDKLKKDWNLMAQVLMHKIFNQQSKKKSLIVGKEHYDVGNELYKYMLDSSMSYSCGYWKDAKNLEEAQWNKLDLICKKLKLKPGMKLLDIGCGWGGMAIHAAKHYGVSVEGITISKEQLKLGQEKANKLKLPIDLKFLDYRGLLKTPGKRFDRVVSIGMFEHIGHKNYRAFMKVANHIMKDDGFLLVHTIGSNSSKFNCDPWLNKYIFPHGVLPSSTQIAKSAEKIFRLEDWHSFGQYYDTTLMAWHKNFNMHWPEIQKFNPQKYNMRFKRMWNYYLLMCAGLFRSRECQLWQAVYSKPRNREAYESVR
jgi:cyclopropane-fatty-acyl-phospholipid synthase